VVCALLRICPLSAYFPITVWDGTESLKGPLKNHSASLFNDDLSNEPNFGQIHLAGQCTLAESRRRLRYIGLCAGQRDFILMVSMDSALLSQRKVWFINFWNKITLWNIDERRHFDSASFFGDGEENLVVGSPYTPDITGRRFMNKFSGAVVQVHI
jgi:hypothetical protein